MRQLLILGLLLAGYGACLATLLGFAGGWNWVLGLFAHFRVQYAAGLLLIAILLAALRCWRHAAAKVAFAGVNLALIAPLYWGGQPGQGEGKPVRAMLFNVNTQQGDPTAAAKVIREAEPGILVLQEISHRWLRDLEPVLAAYPYSEVVPQSDNFGICLFSRYPLRSEEVHWLSGANAPTITAEVELPGGDVQLIATHPLPPMSPRYARLRNEQLERLPTVMKKDMPRLLLGDLNATPWDAHFQGLLREGELHDSARGYGWQPTWPVQIPYLYIPLDHCLHSDAITIVDRQIGRDGGSDHLPLIVDFTVDD